MTKAIHLEWLGFIFLPSLKTQSPFFLTTWLHFKCSFSFFFFLMLFNGFQNHKSESSGKCISWLMQPHLCERFGIFYRDEYNINCSSYTFLEQLPNLHILNKVTLLQWSKGRWLADARKIIYKMKLYPGIKRKLSIKVKVVLKCID